VCGIACLVVEERERERERENEKFDFEICSIGFLRSVHRINDQTDTGHRGTNQFVSFFFLYFFDIAMTRLLLKIRKSLDRLCVFFL
jgi:hypothetical protein